MMRKRCYSAGSYVPTEEGPISIVKVRGFCISYVAIRRRECPAEIMQLGLEQEEPPKAEGMGEEATATDIAPEEFEEAEQDDLVNLSD